MTEHTGYVDDPLQFYMNECRNKDKKIEDLLKRLEQAQSELKDLRRKYYS